MNRKLLFRFTIPSLLVGFVLFVACLISIRYIHRLQENLADILTENVGTLVAAQELQIRVRQLRYHIMLYLEDPRPDRMTLIDTDHVRLEKLLNQVREAAKTDEEQEKVQVIQTAYEVYRKQHEDLIAAAANHPKHDAFKIADKHPVRKMVDPCIELATMYKMKMEATASESQRVSREAYLAMVFLGIAGPIGGLIVGFGVTRGLRRSLYRLSVRVQDLAQHLDRDLGSVSVVADGDLEALDDKMKYIVTKVQEAAKQLQSQQRELLRTEQLSQVGQLAAGVAHEIRNPLTGIKLLVEAAVRPQTRRPLNQDDAELILREVKRLEQTVQQFLNFARLPQPETAPCDLRDLIRQAWDLVQPRARQQQVEPVFHLPNQPVIASVDAGQMTTVLVNLFLNALDATGGTGRVEVFLALPEHGTIRLRVSDSGPGIPPEIQEKLFQPFATNKPHGTGLGLYLSGRILDEHGGAISALNRPEGGASFLITLPVHAEEVAKS